MATIRDVAKECGVSAMTVSAVLNNRPGYASPETRERVLRVVEEMGYQPNAIARGLTRQRMNTLGVILSYEGKLSLTSDRYFSPVLDGVFTATKANHQKTLVITEDHWEDVQANLNTYLDGHCDGLVFVLPILPADAFEPLVRRKLPFVGIGENRPEPQLSTVDMDNVQAGRLATRCLIELGHRRIAHLPGNAFLISVPEREAGYHRAMAEAGLPVDDSLIIAGTYHVESGYERTRALLRREPAARPTAIFCGDDFIAIGAYRALIEAGVRVPEDVSLIGVNGDREAAETGPGLSTVRQPLRQLGERAVEMVLARVALPRDDRPEAGDKVLLPGELVPRGSTAPLV